MGKFRNFWREIKPYPIMIGFFVFLALFTLADMFTPDRGFSELENKVLKQAPSFNLADFFGNKWTLEYGEYTKEQFLFRDGWIDVHAAGELATGKLENSNVWWTAKGNYQIATNKYWSAAQEAKMRENTEAVAQLSRRHPGMVTAGIVPSPANVLASRLHANPPQAPENTLLDETYAAFGAAGARQLDVRAAFAEADATNGQLYYRTDHHWTTRGGAFLAYRQFCFVNAASSAMPADGVLAPGLAVTPDESLLRSVPGYLGTNYARSRRPFTQSDTLEYYDFPYTLTVYKPDETGAIVAQNGPLMDTEKLDAYDKYAAFMRGNNGYSVIEGEGEGSILLLKDSYGNSFAPYLAQNYAKVGVIDLRAFKALGRTVDEVIEEDGYGAVLVLYSFDNFSTDDNMILLMDGMQ